MPLEEGVISLLTIGFGFVIGIATITTVFLWMKNKDNSIAYLWTILHLIFFSIAVMFALKTFATDYSHPMASEEISLNISISGVVWSISMICFVLALLKFTKGK